MMSLFRVSMNVPPVEVTDTGFGIILFFARSAGPVDLSLWQEISTVASAAMARKSFFIGLHLQMFNILRKHGPNILFLKHEFHFIAHPL